MNLSDERAWYYNGSSTISHSRRKQLRGLVGKGNRKPPARSGRTNYAAALCCQMERTSRRSYVGARNSPRSQPPVVPPVVRDFIGSTG